MTGAALVDIGVNLTDRRFGQDREDVLQRARQAGVRAQIITGTSLEGSRQAVALASEHEDLFPTAGVHPHVARDFSSELARELRELVLNASSNIRAVGETGLDFNRDFSPRADQESAFARQLELAAETGMPVFLHQRDAHTRFLPILKEYRDHLPAAVVHCFTGTREELFDYLDLDCHIGITGWLCDERRGDALRAAVHNIPDDRLLVETDSPWLLPRTPEANPPVRKRNEPALLPVIVRALAEHRRQTFEEVARNTFENSCRFFRLTL